MASVQTSSGAGWRRCLGGALASLAFLCLAPNGGRVAHGAAPTAAPTAAAPDKDGIKKEGAKPAPPAAGAKTDSAKADSKAGADKANSAKPDSKETASTKSDKAEAGKPGSAAAASADKGPRSDTPDGEPASGATAGQSKPKARSKPHLATKAEGAGEVSANSPVNVGEGQSPASPPPLTIAGLREEMHREGEGVALDPMAPSRMKLEQMLQEVTKARASLHDETAKLEAMLTQDGGDGAAAGAGGPAAAPGGKPAKNPLDVLAKALRGIKPEQAAPILTRLEKRLAATVLQRMPPVDAGKIMGAMKPDTAAELATQIAMRPLPGEAKR